MELYLSAAAVLLSVISGIYSVIVHFSELRRERRQATLDAFNLLQNEVLDQLNLYRKSKIKEISEDPTAEDYKKISSLLARLEHFAVGVNEKIYDFKTVRCLAGRYLIGLYTKIEPMIEKKRQINKTQLHYEACEKLAMKLRRYYRCEPWIQANSSHGE